jgi:hypothetical protein
VHRSEELVVLLVDRELKRVLVVSEERVVTVGQVGKGAAQVETVFDRGSVVHRSEVVLLDCQDHQLLKDLVSHHKLFASARNVSVVVQNSHACESGDLNLHSDVTGQISVDLSLFGGMDSGVEGSSGVVETLVPDFIDHII